MALKLEFTNEWKWNLIIIYNRESQKFILI